VDLGSLWRSVRDELIAELASPQLRAYLPLAGLVAIVDDTALLAVPDVHARQLIESRARPEIAAALSRKLDRPVQVAVTVRALADTVLIEPPDDEPPAPKQERHLAANPRKPNNGNRLNARYVFESFVVGPSNRFAHAAAVAVAEAPAQAYNPLFLHGGSGLGKTHLLHAIGHYATRLGHHPAIRYVSTEEFTNDFINSLRTDKTQAFHQRYRDADILLIDDIQFLENRDRTQEEFFHTFNALHNAGKQIVISSDRPPRRLETLEKRMRTRFEWGLIVDVEPPDLATRMAILRRNATRNQLAVPDDVLEFIASRATDSIRELEGNLIRVTAFAGLTGARLELSLAERVLRDYLPDETRPAVTVERIIEETAAFLGVSAADLRGPGRGRALTHARQTAMYLCRDLTALTLHSIGKEFGRDHTTVMHAVHRTRARISESRRYYDQIAALTTRITESGRPGRGDH
jgi:chromosomal replication initiator protein